MATNQKDTEQFENALTRAITRYPFFAPGLLRLKATPNNAVDTLLTNGVNIEYNPAFIATLTPGQRVFAILHEWYHVMLMHHTRKGERDHKLWNKAGDYEANGMLSKLDRIELIQGLLIDKKFDDMPVEKIYELLEDEPEEDGGGGESFGDVDPHPGIPEGQEGTEEQQQIEQEVKSQIAAGLAAGKLAGNLPADIARLFEIAIEPAINWRAELIQFIQSTTKDDYSFRRPNNRFPGSGFVLPGLYSEQLDSLIVACDTSGSISDNELKEYTADLISAFETVNIKTMRVLWCDTRIQNVQEFNRGDSIDLKPAGGGGTSFVPPFRYVEDNDIQPCGLIYLTDGYCDRFADEPDYPVLWCVYGGNRDFEPPYGRVLPVKF